MALNSIIAAAYIIYGIKHRHSRSEYFLQGKKINGGCELMKRALIVSTVSRQFYLFEQVNIELLKELGYEIHGAADFSDRNARLDSVDIIKHPIDIKRNPFSLKNITAYRQLKKLMKEYDFDLVHCHSPVGGVLARLAAKAAGIKKVIYTAHGFHFCRGAPLINWLLFYPVERWLAGYTDTIITINREDYRRAKAFGRCRVEYVPGIGIDTAAYTGGNGDRSMLRGELGITDEETVIISVGEFIKRKNQKVIIKSLAAMKDDKVKLLLCGIGKREKKLREMVRKYGLEDKVVFMGYRDDIPRLLGLADIFVLSSYMEGLPVALMEAMASGLPVVCSRIRGNTDLLIHKKGGFLVPPDDSEAYTKAFRRLLADKDLRMRFGAYNKERIKQNDREIIKRKMRKIYKNVEGTGIRRIAFVTGSMACGGAQRVISILANSYADLGWQVDIIMLLENKCAFKLRENIRLIDICNENRPRLLYLPVWLYRLRKYMKEKKPDKIVSMIAGVNIVTLLAGLGLEKDIIAAEGSNPKRDGRSFIVRLATYILYPLAKRIIFQTRAQMNCFPAFVRAKGVIVPNPVEVHTLASYKRSPKIVSAGRLAAEKNHRMLIDAFAKIKAEHPEYSLYIYGEGPLRAELEAQIKMLGLEGSAFLPGNAENLHECMADAEIFVLSSYHEGLSNALIEAMMMGLPCISTIYDGVKELIKNGRNGLLVKPDDDEQLYRMLNILINDKEKALSMGMAGRISVEHMMSKNCLPVWRSCIEE